MTPVKLNLKVYQGSTFSEVLRWSSQKKVYKSISNISQAAPCVVQCDSNHELPEDWSFRITNVVGMSEINSLDVYHKATVVNPTTIEINSVNSLGYKTYVSGGVVEYNEPVDLSGYTARMQIREKLDSDTIIHELTTENGGILLDNVNKKIILFISAATTALFTFNTAVYSIEMVSTKVIPLATGTLTLVKEITR